MEFIRLIQCEKCGNQFPSNERCKQCRYTQTETSSEIIKGEESPEITLFPTFPARVSKPQRVEIEIEGKPVIIERTSEEDLAIMHDEKKILSIPAKKVGSFQCSGFFSSSPGSTEVYQREVSGHILRVQYKVSPSLFLFNLIFGEGMDVHVDGVPVRGTLSDPAQSLRTASHALYVLAGVGGYELLITPLLSQQMPSALSLLFSISVIGGLIFLASRILRQPMLSTAIGSCVGILMTFSLVASNLQRIITSTWIWGTSISLLFWFSLIGGSTFFVLRGFLAARKIRRWTRSGVLEPFQPVETQNDRPDMEKLQNRNFIVTIIVIFFVVGLLYLLSLLSS